MEIYLIRHTKLKIDSGTCYGQSDIGIADSFEREVEELLEKLPFFKDIVLYSSPLNRCLELSKKLANSKPIIDNRLREINFGEWELKKWDSLDKIRLQEWTDDFINMKTPNGESYMDLYKRVIEFFEELIKRNHKKVALITHGGVIRSILSYILEIPLKNSFSLQIDYGKISKIRINHQNDLNSIIIIEFINK